MKPLFVVCNRNLFISNYIDKFLHCLGPAESCRIDRGKRILSRVGVQIALLSPQAQGIEAEESSLLARIEACPHVVQPIRLGHDSELADELERVRDVAGR